MKHSFRYLIPVALVLFQACNPDNPTPDNKKEEETPSGPVSISVTIDQGTRASVAETGAITFSKGDAIKIFNGTGVYLGITQSTDNSGMFSMADGFSATGSGFAGFPADLVKDITSEGVTFSLPSTYRYALVGGADADASRVPCPMVGDFNGGDGIALKPACALVRFYLTDVAAGTLTFTFQNTVTGRVTITTPSSLEDGILSDDLTSGGRSITVTGVPEVGKGDYIYITLPVPTGTVPENIAVINQPEEDGAMPRTSLIAGSSSPLARSAGHKLMDFSFKTLRDVGSQGPFSVAPGKVVYLAPGNLMAHISAFNTPIATADEWKFGEPFEYIDGKEGSGNYYLLNRDPQVIDKWVDLFMWQGASVPPIRRAQGLIMYNSEDYETLYNSEDYETFTKRYCGNAEGDDPLYPGCWRTKNKNEFPATDGYIHISNGGRYDWRPLSQEEWDYLLNEREGARVGSYDNCRFSTIFIGEDKRGVLLFPDSDTDIWDTTTMGAVPCCINNNTIAAGDSGDNQYTLDNWAAMQEAGMTVLTVTTLAYGGLLDADYLPFGVYWTSTPDGPDVAWAMEINTSGGWCGPSDWGGDRISSQAVRLARDE